MSSLTPEASDGGETAGSARPRPLSRRDLLTLRTAREASGHWIRIHRVAMACRFEVLLDAADARHADAARDALDEADRIEGALTVFRETSEIRRINRAAAAQAVSLDAEVFGLLRTCALLHARSEGAFDITSTPLSRCWGFLRREGRLPSPEAVEAARRAVGMDGVELDPAALTVRFRRPGLELNLGSIGKGYALDRMAERMRARGVRDALVSAGGSSAVAIGGVRGWTVDVRSRRVGQRRLARLSLVDGGMATSGAGEQFFEVEGRRYGHLIDPRTGWPASGVASVTVVGAEAAGCDALSTAFFIGGLDLARRYCASHPGTLVLLTPDDGSGATVTVGAFAGARVEAA